MEYEMCYKENYSLLLKRNYFLKKKLFAEVEQFAAHRIARVHR